MRTIIIALASLLAVGIANAQERSARIEDAFRMIAACAYGLAINCNSPSYATLPPKEFDHPYRHKLIVRTVNSEAAMQTSCSDGSSQSPFETTLKRWRLGCARAFDYSIPPTCIVHLRDEETLRQYNRTRELVLRHEIGHCNGWSNSHEGAIRVDILPDATDSKHP